MPKLRGEQIPRPTGTNAQRLSIRDDEITIGCPRVRNQCDWQTIRPLHAAHSAQTAHMIQHAKGMRLEDGGASVARAHRPPKFAKPAPQRQTTWDDREESTWIDRM